MPPTGPQAGWARPPRGAGDDTWAAGSAAVGAHARGPRPPHEPSGRPGALRHALPLWRRMRLPYLAGLAVLFPVMLVWPYSTEYQAGLDRGSIPPEARLVDGDTATLAGSEWRSVGSLVGNIGDEEPPPEGVQLVDMAFEVTPSDEEASELLAAHCAFRAVDTQGRSWTPTHEYSLRRLLDEPGNFAGGACTNAEHEPIAPGESQAFAFSFLVPEDVAEDLLFEVTVATSTAEQQPRPEAVLFEAEILE
ncbi:hypothetical protein ACFXKD_28120 [Nocardiopsis aegyptia]|uniref:hypothetical protein n=1 Tax=Nocardiopsis aegyptia TaxID=220378 RepID=UPI00366E8E94